MQNHELRLFLAIFGIFHHFCPFSVAHISRRGGLILLVERQSWLLFGTLSAGGY
jgi:hypothetical protein